LKARITSKIGLKDTYLGVGNTDPSKNEALSYGYLGGWREAAELDFSITGGAAPSFRHRRTWRNLSKRCSI
ncbi:MAG TPA: hypothetical protein VFB63_31075, partial [Bryobacteraceae bacterium]|nr:hypothetical protein [Bryobacteraceae bacterium]